MMIMMGNSAAWWWLSWAAMNVGQYFRVTFHGHRRRRPPRYFFRGFALFCFLLFAGSTISPNDSLVILGWPGSGCSALANIRLTNERRQNSWLRLAALLRLLRFFCFSMQIVDVCSNYSTRELLLFVWINDDEDALLLLLLMIMMAVTPPIEHWSSADSSFWCWCFSSLRIARFKTLLKWATTAAAAARHAAPVVATVAGRRR